MAELKAVIYARYSSSSQREESIEAQLNVCNAYAVQNGYMVIGNYIDKAKSGTTDKRPEFQKMIRESKRKQFDIVLVYPPRKNCLCGLRKRNWRNRKSPLSL